MKYILAAMCGLIVLFMGGCAVLSLAAGPLAVLPAGIAFLNLAVIGALFGWKVQWKPAFYILGVIDLVAAAGCIATNQMGGNPADLTTFLYIIAAVFGLKGVLSFVYAKSNPESEEP
jgi:hypothetical protein